MNIYLLSQTVCRGYDTYDSAVVIAESEETARMTHPAEWGEWCGSDCWPDPQYVEVTLLGVANPDAKPGVVCASFNAG